MKIDLINAAKHGDIEQVKKLIENGVDVNVVDDDIAYGSMPLMYACKRGDYNMVKLLIDADADMFTATNGGWTPLMSASYRGDNDIVKLLIDAGIDMNAEDKHGWTAIAYAVRGNNGYHIETIKLLLESGAREPLKLLNYRFLKKRHLF